MGKTIRRNHSIRWNKFIKGLLFLMGFLTICLPQSLQAQQGPCSEPKVAVLLEEIIDEVFDHLYRQHPFQPKEAWLRQIQEKVMQELRKNSPGTQFISASGKPSEDCDYSFNYILRLIGAGEEKEIAGLKTSAYTAYFMISELKTIGKCNVLDKAFNHAVTKDNPDIFQTIEQNIAAHGNIGHLIREHEDSHPVPPRGPELEVSQEPEKVSPLEEETELDIKIKVINCEGESVYDKRHGQPVLLPRKTDRGELKPTKGFNQDSKVTENFVMLIITSPEGASATYTLKKGTDPGLEQIKISTCGLEKIAVAETEIHISGLEIKVTPRRRTLRPGEKTQIQLEFNKVDKEGNKESVVGKKLNLEVKGLVDGSVSPEDDIQTDENGKATLTYWAGDSDKKVTFQAEYHPKDFTETVKGKAVVKVFREAVWTGTVTYRRSYDRNWKGKSPDGATVTAQETVSEHADIQIHGWTYSHSYDDSTGTDLYYEGDENSVTGSYSGSYKRIYTVQDPSGGWTNTDTASCHGTIRDSGHLVINNEEMKTYLSVGLSMVGGEKCQGQSKYSSSGGSYTLEFDWANQHQFAGYDSLETNISAKNPQTVTGSYSIPSLGITWTWNLSLTGR